MLNEYVVKNINKLDKEQDNINLELSKKASKEDLDKLIQGGTNVAISKDISTNDWILEESTYTTIVEHNLVTRKVLISLIDKTTNNNIFCSYQILDDNRIKVFNESNNVLECIVVNGNSAVNMVSATIDDNRSTKTTTYSSIKIEALLKSLENKIDDIENLKEVDNIKCSTDIGEYTIENSKKGYLTNFNIEGKTLVNLANPNNITVTEGLQYLKPFKYIEKEKQYTFINLSNKEIYYFHDNIIKFQMNPNSRTLYTIDIDITDTNCLCIAHSIKGWGETDADKQEFTKSVMILEGDYTSVDIDYFEGMQSVGQGDNIKLLSYQGENLFDGTYQDGYFNGNSLEEELIQGMPCITTNWIECNPNVEYYFLGGNRKQIQFKNENNIFKSVILNSNNFETPTDCTHFRLYYARTDQFYSPLNIYKEGDIKIIPYTLRSLPSGIKDEIIYKNNSYKLLQNCEEITINGQENWTELKENATNETLLFNAPIGANINGQTNNTNIWCDKFKPYAIWGTAYNFEGIYETKTNIWIRILRSRLVTQDLAGFKIWLNNNNITLIRQIETKEINLIDLGLKTFENETRFVINIGSIIPTINFEVTRNFGSNIEILKNKINTLENIYTYSKIIDLSDKLLNGWKKAYDIHQGLILIKIGNIVQISSVIKDGLFTAGTIIACLPKDFTPSKIAPIQIFDSGESLGSLEIRPEGYIKLAIVNKNSTRIIFNGSYILD
ncbi:hypothetical protein GSQ51_17820 [Clostridioides difficile]|nr:hypothetical protein [Clostridioides difficile]NJK15947.1 hypothetical protein [Clostridioides difficile]